MIKFKYESIEAGTELKPIVAWDPINNDPVRGKGHKVVKGYKVVILSNTPIGVVFQTNYYGKGWLAIDRYGHLWVSYAETRKQAADWLLKRFES